MKIEARVKIYINDKLKDSLTLEPHMDHFTYLYNDLELQTSLKFHILTDRSNS